MAIVEREVDPISRIEGHLGVKLHVDDTTGRVTSADAHGNLWRGFENFLIGREVNDAITFTQRICGVCPIPHGQSATFAADSVLGYNEDFQTFVASGQYSPSGQSAYAVSLGETDDRTSVPAGQGIPAKAVLIRNLVLSSEFLMSHITHSYHLAAPSYIQGPNIPPWTPYYHNTFYHPALQATGKGISAATNVANTDALHNGATLPLNDEGFSVDLWSAVIKSYVKALRIRRLTFEAGALFAGRMPMTSCFVAGGVTTDKTENLAVKCTKFRDIMEEVGTFIVKEFTPIFLALGALYPNYDNLANATVLNSVYPTLWTAGNQAASGVPAAGNTGWGAGLGNFLSWGAFPQADGYLAFRRGYMVGAGGATQEILAGAVATNLTEHIAHSRYQGSATFDVDGNVDLDTAATITYPATEARTVPERDGVAFPDKYSWMKAPRWYGNAMEVGPMARMFVGRYFQNGVALASTVPGYTAYVKTHADTGQGLSPSMVNADLAVALVRSGLATLEIRADLTSLGLGTGVQNWTVWNQATDASHIDVAALAEATIGLAYGLANAVIKGAAYDWIYNLSAGLSNMDRLRARAIESLVLIQAMIGGFSVGATDVVWTGTGGWIGDLASATGGTYIQKSAPTVETFGFGASEAPRGALMHMCTIGTNGLIKKYQCIVPTTWNGSPKDTTDNPGAMEKAMENIPYSTQKTGSTGGAGAAIVGGAAGGVEALRVAQSFDPCIACAVH